MPSGIFDSNTALVDLDCSYNNIAPTLPFGLFGVALPLKKINFSYNHLVYLTARTFDKAGATLISLYLNDNELQQNNAPPLPVNMFAGLGKLQELTLYQNQIHNINNGVFNGLSSLTYLNFAMNGAASIAPGALKPLVSLITLNFALNTGCQLVPNGEVEQLLPHLQSLTTPFLVQWGGCQNYQNEPHVSKTVLGALLCETVA
jgi:Leucine-rich repeat (LRR) protein